MSDLTNETAWWQPRAGKKLKDLPTAELNALAAGIERALYWAGRHQSCPVGEEMLAKLRAELVERGNPLVTS